MKIKIIGIVLLIAVACSRYEVDYNDDTVVIGHGGMGITHDYPLNSFESLSLALNKGVNGVEIDVQMTKDSVLVAFHDESLEVSTSLRGKIHDYDWSELAVAKYDRLLYTTYDLVALDDFFSNQSSFANKYYFFDIKTVSPDTTGAHLKLMVEELVNMISSYNLENSVIEIRSAELGQLIKELDPSIEVFVYREWETALAMNNNNDFDGITIDVDLLTQGKVYAAHSAGLKIAVINTHSIERNDLAYALGVDYNQTDMVTYVMRNKK